MTVFGHQWGAHPIVDDQYDDGKLDGVNVKYHAPDDGKPIVYDCQLCRKEFFHWLCDDRVWRSLPSVLHDKVICPRCFTAVRTLAKLQRKK